MLKLFVRKLPPIVITSHGGDLYALKSNTGKVLKKWVLARANAITVVSSAMKEYCIQELAIEPSKVQVLSMGVDLKSTFIPNSSLVRENKNIIFVGRMVEKKGVKYLIKAMPSVLAAEPNAKLTLIGDGLLRGRIESDVKELGLEDSVTLLGAVSNQLIPDYLSASAIAVVPSIIDSNGDQEGLGLVAVEAMGCGCAVVVSDLPALRDVVKNGETGMMVEPQCPEDIANKLVYLLSNQSRCREIADNGRRFVITKFDWDDVAAKYRVVLNAAMGFEAGLEG
jgi:glycosyltransferase involved in cell wall biosynthesis